MPPTLYGARLYAASNNNVDTHPHISHHSIMPPIASDSMSPDPLGPIKALTVPYLGMNEPVRRRRMRRVKFLTGKASTSFHLMSRLCEGVPFFDDTEKEALALVLRRMARFCGLHLLTYCVMGNHFHALVRVPDRQEWLKTFEGNGGEARLLIHLRTLYSETFVEMLSSQLARWRQDGREDLALACINGIKARFCDISIFCKEVKARFARWYNKRHSRRGVLWMARFMSVLVEGHKTAIEKSQAYSELDALKVMAAYIDLNPVRAGLVETADAYRWSGWGAADGGDADAIAGLCAVVECEPRQWSRGGGRRAYASWVSERRKEPGQQPSSSDGSLLESVRAFRQGIAIGSVTFVETIFEQCREAFGPKRQHGARPIDHALIPHLVTLRDLRKRLPE
jgi:REP element-mobilizing transposase RayT